MDQQLENYLKSQNPNYKSPNETTTANTSALSPDAQIMVDKIKGQIKAHDDAQDLSQYPDYLTKNLSRENKLPWQLYVPKEATDMAAGIAGRGSDQGRANEATQREGILKYGMGDNKVSGADSLGSKSVSTMSQALTNKYQSGVSDKLNSLKAQQMIEANPELKASQELSRASEIYGKDQAVSMQNFKEQYNYQIQRAQMLQQFQSAKNNAEAQTLSSVLGLGLTVASAAIPGIGPAVAPTLLAGNLAAGNIT